MTLTAGRGGAKRLNMKGSVLQLNSSCVLSIQSVQVKMMQLFFIWMMFLFNAECKGEDSVKQPTEDLIRTEGDTVTLHCTYQTTYTGPTLFWYKQEGTNKPTFILSRFTIGEGKTEKEFEERFSSTLNSTTTSVPLKIQKLQPSDSAVYYCALRTGGSDKLLFGSGAKVSVESREVYDPSYYLLGDGDTKVCLAAGFSQYNKHNGTEPFDGTQPARIHGDSLFNQVAFVSGKEEDLCDQDAGGSSTCEETLKPDPTVNLVSMTVLGLRLLLVKTIVFNVLMTLRLWVSQ